VPPQSRKWQGGTGVVPTLVLALILSAAAHAAPNGTVELHDTLQGHFVYMRNCVFCHGRRGDGKGEMGLTVKPPPRDFSAGIFKYRSTPTGTLPTDEDLVRTVRMGVADTAMPAFTALPERDLRAVVQYVKTFSPKWRQRGNYGEPIQVPARPEWFDDAAQRRVRAEGGRRFFAVSCAPCHGPDGDGGGAATNLVDTWGHAVAPRDLRLPYLRSGREWEDVYRVLVTGLDGTPMPSFAESTTVEQRWELVAFIAELRRRKAMVAH